MQIKDKTVVITGAARGIGRALAVRFARQGANIALLDLNAADLQPATQQCAALGVRAIAYAVNVSMEEQVSARLDQVVARFRRARCHRQQRRHRQRCAYCSKSRTARWWAK